MKVIDAVVQDAQQEEIYLVFTIWDHPNLRDDTHAWGTGNQDLVAVDARPSDALALTLRTQAPIFVEEHVIDNAKTVDLSQEPANADRLQKWLESLDPEELGKYKM